MHTFYHGWVIHHWMAYGDFYCFYHVESQQADRVKLKLLYHEPLGGEPTGHECEKYEPRPPEAVDKHVWDCIYSRTLGGVLRVVENIERMWVEDAIKEMRSGTQ